MNEDNILLKKHKDKIFELIKQDFSNSLPSYRAKNERIRRYRRIYEDRESNSTKGSSYRSRQFKKALRRIVPNISQPITSSNRIVSVDITSSVEHNEAENMLGGLINYQLKSTRNFDNLVQSLAKDFSIDGTGILKSTWDRNEKKEKVGTKEVTIYAKDKKELDKFLGSLDKGKSDALKKIPLEHALKTIPIGTKKEDVYEVSILRNRSNIRVVDPLRVIVDNSSKGDITKARFLMEVIDTDIDSLESNFAEADVGMVKKLLSEHEKNIESYSKSSIGILAGEIYGNGQAYDEYESYTNEALGGPQDSKRKKVDIIEYWGEVPIDGDNGRLVPIVAIWIDDVLLSLKVNPMPHKSIPYSFGNYESVHGSVFGESDADIIAEDQIGLTLAMRNMQNITQKNEIDGTQEFIENGFLPDVTQINNYRNGNTVFFKKGMDPSRAIHRRTVDDIPAVLFDMRNMYKDELAQSIGDISDMNQPTDADFSDGSDNRMQKLVDGFASIFQGAGEFIASMNMAFTLDEDIYKINGKVKKASKEILLGINDYVITVNTSAQNNEKIQNILSMMNTRSANMSEKISAYHYAKIAELSGMNEFGESVLNEVINAKPTPQDEMEMQRMKLELKKVELDIARIDSETKLNLSRSNEWDTRADERERMIKFGYPESEAMLSRAKAAANFGQANKLSAQTKMFNQEFNLEESGENRLRDKEDKEFAHGANLERESIRTDRELTLLEKKKDANHDGKVTKEESDDFLANYIKEGTLNNDSYDAIGDVYRNILDKRYQGGSDNAIVNEPQTQTNESEENK